jgi:hypothetical protein
MSCPNCSHWGCQNPAIVKIEQGGKEWYGCAIHQDYNALEPVTITTVSWTMTEEWVYPSEMIGNDILL